MISIIICSIKPDLLARVSDNISNTIGCDHEFVVRDNRGSKDGICKVYNELASQAKGDFFCFVHEDVLFDSSDWGNILISKALDPKTGVIGFAGSAAKSKNLSGVIHPRYAECNVIEMKEGRSIPRDYPKHTICNLEFAPVVMTDGVFLFIRKDVFYSVGGFDEKTFDGFHLYDLDLATSVTMAGFQNYVCHSVRMCHYSNGQYNQQWYDQSMRYIEKWNDILPLYVNRPSEKQVAIDEKYMHFNITYHLLKRGNQPPEQLWPRIKKQLKESPLYHKSYYQLYRYLRYKTEYNNKK